MGLRGFFADLVVGGTQFNAAALGVVKRATVTLTDAQVKALPTTPIALVAAQGAGTIIQPLSVTLVGRFGAAAYTNINAAAELAVQLGGVDYMSYLLDNAAASRTDFSAVFGTAAVTHAQLQPWAPTVVALGSIARGSASGSTLVNAALTITVDNAGSGALTGGNAANELLVHVIYTVEASE